MARCEKCNKGTITGHRISITRSQVSRRANRKWRPNIKKGELVDPKTGAVRSARLCTSCLRTQQKPPRQRKRNKEVAI